MVLSLRDELKEPDPTMAVWDKFMERFSESMRKLTDQLVESLKQACQNSDPKHIRRVLICRYTEEEDCICVATETMESEYNDLDDVVVVLEEENSYQSQLQTQNDGDLTGRKDEDPITPEVGDCTNFQAQIEASNPPIQPVCIQLIPDKVTSLPHTDFSSPSLSANTAIGMLYSNKKELIVANEVFDKSPERRGYMAALNPDPPDDYGPINHDETMEHKLNPMNVMPIYSTEDCEENFDEQWVVDQFVSGLKEAPNTETTERELNMKVNFIFSLPLISSDYVYIFASVISSTLGCFGYWVRVFDEITKRNEYSWKFELKEDGLYWGKRGKTEITEFSFSHFQKLYLLNYDGHHSKIISQAKRTQLQTQVECENLVIMSNIKEILRHNYQLSPYAPIYMPKASIYDNSKVKLDCDWENYAETVLEIKLVAFLELPAVGKLFSKIILRPLKTSTLKLPKQMELGGEIAFMDTTTKFLLVILRARTIRSMMHFGKNYVEASDNIDYHGTILVEFPGFGVTCLYWEGFAFLECLAKKLPSKQGLDICKIMNGRVFMQSKLEIMKLMKYGKFNETIGDGVVVYKFSKHGFDPGGNLLLHSEMGKEFVEEKWPKVFSEKLDCPASFVQLQPRRFYAFDEQAFHVLQHFNIWKKYIENEMNMHCGKFDSSHSASQSTKSVISKISKVKKEIKCWLVVNWIEDLGIMVAIIESSGALLENKGTTNFNIHDVTGKLFMVISVGGTCKVFVCCTKEKEALKSYHSSFDVNCIPKFPYHHGEQMHMEEQFEYYARDVNHAFTKTEYSVDGGVLNWLINNPCWEAYLGTLIYYKMEKGKKLCQVLIDQMGIYFSVIRLHFHLEDKMDFEGMVM